MPDSEPNDVTGWLEAASAGALRAARELLPLEIIKLGMDTKEVIARFEAERQALAILDQ